MYYDKNFLLQLDRLKNKEIYARITSLTFDELPVEQIEGKITSGSINIDGTSAVRRTCSVNMVSTNLNYHDNYWTFKTKFKLEIGIKNTINPKYPDIIWFSQGIYLITSFNGSHTVDNISLSIQGKDKMSLLNGDIGGQIPALTDFGTIQEENNDGTWVISKIPIKDIILNMVHTYANEPYHNIIINDLDTFGLELVEYKYDTPMYLYKLEGARSFNNITLDGNVSCIYNNIATTFDQLPLSAFCQVTNLKQDIYPVVKVNGKNINIMKIMFGDAAGYKKTELVYAGDLIANIGDTITSVLDKIKNMLVQFEYFYNTDGQFVFQKKKSYLSTIWGETTEEIIKGYEGEERTYEFNNFYSLISCNTNPDISKIKNDFSVWGSRPSVASGQALPVHYRYAVDIKPTIYTSYDGTIFSINDYDWRELIYQMAKDQLANATKEDFISTIIQNNNWISEEGLTGYEHYYTDMLGFWRQLYDPTVENLGNEDAAQAKLNELTQEYIQIEDKGSNEAKAKEKEIKRYEKFLNFNLDGWSKMKDEAPEQLNFWFDFLDTEGQICQYNKKNIGVRTKVINDNNVKGIYFKEIPDVIYINNAKDIEIDSGYAYIQIPTTLEDMFSLSARGISAKERIDELMYEHLCMPISITLTAVPIYHLEPNTRVYVHDDDTGIDGDYIITKLTIPLGHEGNLSINATKAIEDKI